MNTTKKNAAFAAAFALSALLSATSAHAVSIVNGNFETEGTAHPASGGFTDVVAPNTTAMAGWSVTAGSIDYINGYWQAADFATGGTHSVDLNGLSAGTISQQITGLTIGHVYQIDFQLAGNPDGGPVTKIVGVTASINSQGYTFDTTGHDKTNMGWVGESFTFTAGHTEELLSFVSGVFFGGAPPNGAAFGPVIDDVSILDRGDSTPLGTPLPAALPLFASGLGALGFVGWRRKRKVAKAAA
jgi:choice-of-anchor C domain-containing protein